MLKDINNDHICSLIEEEEEDDDDDEDSTFVAEQMNGALNRKTNDDRVLLNDIGGGSSPIQILIPWDNVQHWICRSILSSNCADRTAVTCA